VRGSVPSKIPLRTCYDDSDDEERRGGPTRARGDDGACAHTCGATR